MAILPTPDRPRAIHTCSTIDCLACMDELAEDAGYQESMAATLSQAAATLDEAS